MQRVSQYIWRCESDSNPSKYYVVDVTPGSESTCTCVAYAIARNKALKQDLPIPGCKHIRYVAEEAALEKYEEETLVQQQVEEIAAKESLLQTLRELGG